MLNRKERKAKNNGTSLLMDVEDNLDSKGLITKKWNINDKLNSNSYSFKFCKTYQNGLNFSLKTLEKDGFSVPLFFENIDGLGLNLPFKGFGVNDVEDNVGMDRILNAMDVNTQNAVCMTMREWCRYFNRPKKEKLLNVISLEFSQTKMDCIVKAPDVVLELDWLETIWPQCCRDISVNNRSYLMPLTYPKVRKYCLMGVKGCYTDFHIDLGGTSVWYHIFKGEKVFWMVPPTEENLEIYEQWCQSADQSSRFFADLVPQCERVHLREGNTFMIPSGWIHGVYTLVDSLVFGGNFLHSLSINKQLTVWSTEERIKVSSKYRYPFFVEMHWYVLATFVGTINGKCYIKKKESKYPKIVPPEIVPRTSLTDYETSGIKPIYQWLVDLPIHLKKLIPNNISDSDELLSDAETVIQMLSSVPQISVVDQVPVTDSCNSPEPSNISTPPIIEDVTKAAIDENIVSEIEKIDSEIEKIDSENEKIDSEETKPLTATLTKECIVQTNRPSKRQKLIHPLGAELPLEMFNRITQREGSRKIQRPQRLIEGSLK